MLPIELLHIIEICLFVLEIQNCCDAFFGELFDFTFDYGVGADVKAGFANFGHVEIKLEIGIHFGDLAVYNPYLLRIEPSRQSSLPQLTSIQVGVADFHDSARLSFPIRILRAAPLRIVIPYKYRCVPVVVREFALELVGLHFLTVLLMSQPLRMRSGWMHDLWPCAAGPISNLFTVTINSHNFIINRFWIKHLKVDFVFLPFINNKYFSHSFRICGLIIAFLEIIRIVI